MLFNFLYYLFGFFVTFNYYLLGSRPYAHGHVGGSQLATVSGQINIGHTPPLVRKNIYYIIFIDFVYKNCTEHLI